jgi:2,3-bisphosphoglycerate-dependent phosphoglycerate mutase
VPGRARRFLAELRERHGGSDDRVAVFSHAGFYQSVMGALLDSPRPDTDWQDPAHVWFVLHNVGISRIDFSATGSLAIRYLNRVSFLPDELVT